MDSLYSHVFPTDRDTPIDYIHRYWRQVSPEDRLRFLIEMTTLQERRALAYGLDDEEETP